MKNLFIIAALFLFLSAASTEAADYAQAPSNPSAPPAINPPQAEPGTGAPPYARPLVPAPRHVPYVHAGP